MAANPIKPSQLLGTINVPPQDLAKLSFSNSNKANSVKAWVESLQATQVFNTSSLFHTVLPEIARLKTDYQNRFAILENLRPSVQYCIIGLQKSFLNQPLILPEEAQKSAIVAQSLQKYMVDAYIVTIIQIAQAGKLNKNALDYLAKSIHRAISGIGLLFYRNYQIYAQPPANLRASLNILYLAANYYELTTKSVIDTNLRYTRANAIEAAFARILLMDTAKTNQMSQNEIGIAFDVCELWCQKVKLSFGLSESKQNLYVVNLLSSQGPIYKSKIADISKGNFLEIDLKALLGQLSKVSTTTDDMISGQDSAQIPKEYSSSLNSHLIEAWGNIAQRKHNRKHTDAEAEVCVGLIDCHYFVCNAQEFSYFLQNSGSDEPEKISRFSTHPNSFATAKMKRGGDEIPTHHVVAQNSSSGGYCLLWQGKISPKVSAGEILGIKESGKRTWNLGIIRWIRQLKNASQIGVQLLSNNPKPYGLANTNEMGGYADYTRAFFIPPNKFGQRKPTILCSSAPFQELDKVKVLDGEQDWHAKLDRCVFSTKNLRQFTFHNVESDETEERQTNTGESFDSQWD